MRTVLCCTAVVDRIMCIHVEANLVAVRFRFCEFLYLFHTETKLLVLHLVPTLSYLYILCFRCIISCFEFGCQ